jgi:hypothetical protein
VSPAASSAQYTPVTSISQLDFPNQVTNGSPAVVMFAVTFAMGGYSHLEAYIWDGVSQTFQAASASASPNTCSTNTNSECRVYIVPYSVGVESFVFHLNLSSGTHQLEARASITDSNYVTINGTASRQHFSIMVSSTVATQIQSTTSTVLESQSYEAVPQETSQQTSQSTMPLEANFNLTNTTAAVLWIALALSITSVITSVIVLLRPPRRFEKVVFEEDGSIQKTDHQFPLTKATMFCRYCGVRIPRDSKFCQECGATLA